MGKMSQNKISKYRRAFDINTPLMLVGSVHTFLSPVLLYKGYINLFDLRNSAADYEAGSFSQGCGGEV